MKKKLNLLKICILSIYIAKIYLKYNSWQSIKDARKNAENLHNPWMAVVIFTKSITNIYSGNKLNKWRKKLKLLKVCILSIHIAKIYLKYESWQNIKDARKPHRENLHNPWMAVVLFIIYKHK